MTDTPTPVASDAAPDDETSPPLATWKKLLFSAVLALILFVILEVGASLYLRATAGYAGGAFQQYEYDPYKSIGLSRNWEDTRGVRHNAQGFRRDSNVVREKPEGTFRVFLMGASTAYGTGGLWPHLQKEFEVLDNSETIDAYLEPLLAQRLNVARVEVINAAVPSTWTHHHLINLNQTILGYDPDLILFLDGWNDHFFYDLRHDQFASYAYGEQATVIMGPPTLGSLVRMNGWWLFRKSAFFHLLSRVGREAKLLVFRPQRAPALDVPKAVAQQHTVFERNALKMIERNALILRQEGIPTLFMLQPILSLERERMARMPDIEKKLFEFNLSAWPPGYEDFIRQAVPYVAQRTRETVEPLGARFVDLTELFPTSDGQIFTDYVHLTPEGNRRVAERAADEVVALLAARNPAVLRVAASARGSAP